MEHKENDIQALQPYTLTMAKHELTAIEMRIMSLILLELKEAQINEFDSNTNIEKTLKNNFHTIKIKNSDIKIGENYSQVKKALKNLNNRQIELKKNNGVYIFNLIREAYYSYDKNIIDIDLSPQIIPELINLSKNYTKYGIEFIFKTKSSYAIRWYQIANHWINNSLFILNIQEIKELFKTGEKYKELKRFSARVIREPINEVNLKSNINIEIYKIHKAENGKTINGYTFKVSRKEKNLKENFLENEFLINYLTERGKKILNFCEKTFIEYESLINKIRKRNNKNYKNQIHFNNSTDKYIAKIINGKKILNLTEYQIIKELKN